MSAVPNPCESKPAQGSEDGASFSQELVSITKAQHIELVSQAKQFQSLHARAVRREQWRHERFGRIVQQIKKQAGKREAELLAQLALAQAQIRDLRQRVFGRKSEQGKGASEQRRFQAAARAPRGQRDGTRGHGRSMQSHLPKRGESVRLDSPFTFGTYAVQLHELLNAFLANADAPGQQFLPGARPAVATASLGVDGLDMHQQRVVAQVAPLRSACATHEVLVESGHTHLKHPALHRNRPFTPVSLNEGVLHFAAFAKYAVAFPKMSRSIFTRANPARSRLISICSALTTFLSIPVSLPARLGLVQPCAIAEHLPDRHDVRPQRRGLGRTGPAALADLAVGFERVAPDPGLQPRLCRRRSAHGPALCAARSLRRDAVVGHRGGLRLCAPTSERRQRGAAGADPGGLLRLHPATPATGKASKGDASR